MKKQTKSKPTYSGFLTHMDYFATGEGRTVELNFCYAENKKEAVEKHLSRFWPNDKKAAEYFTVGTKAMPIESKEAQDTIKSIFRFGKGLHKDLVDAGCEFYLKYYVNHS